MPRYENKKTSGARAKLREDILNKVYKTGTYLPSARELAKKLNLSKSSVHNLLKFLQEEGLIQIYPNIGALVLQNGINRTALRRLFLRPSDYGTFNYLPQASELMLGVIRGAELKNVEVNLSLSDSGLLTEEIIMGRSNDYWQGAIYTQCQNYEGLIAPLEKSSVPYVIAADYHCHEQAVRVYVDLRKCARRAVRYLASKGHREIGILCGDPGASLYAEMLAGYRGGLAEEGLAYLPEHVVVGLYRAFDTTAYAEAEQVIHNYLTKPGRPSAVFCVRDYRAELVFRIAAKLKLRIPEDLSVICFGGGEWKEAGVRGLTMLEEPLRQQGELAASMLYDWVRTGVRPESRCMDVKLIERNSVASLLDTVR